jgi:hypothetical protein
MQSDAISSASNIPIIYDSVVIAPKSAATQTEHSVCAAFIDRCDGSGLNPLYGRIIAGNTMSRDEFARMRARINTEALEDARALIAASDRGEPSITVFRCGPGASVCSFLPIHAASIAEAWALIDAVKS